MYKYKMYIGKDFAGEAHITHMVVSGDIIQHTDKTTGKVDFSLRVKERVIDVDNSEFVTLLCKRII